MADRITYDDDGKTLDEICVSGCNVHMERMDSNHIWLGIDVPGKETICVNLSSRKRLTAIVEGGEWLRG